MIAGIVVIVGTFLLYRITRRVNSGVQTKGFRVGQIGSATLVSLAHGTNDAQKTMGVITLALIANGSLAAGTKAPSWVIVSCAIAIALGTYLGGWRIIRTLGKGLVEIDAPQGMAASPPRRHRDPARVPLRLLAVDHPRRDRLHPGLRCRQGGARKFAGGVAGRMATAWLFTLPMAALVGAASVRLGQLHRRYCRGSSSRSCC